MDVENRTLQEKQRNGAKTIDNKMYMVCEDRLLGFFLLPMRDINSNKVGCSL